METLTKKKLYEAMFLVDSGDAGSDWDGIVAAITKILERAEVEIVSIRKWDDRKMAYEIKGKSRGTYLLCYFRSDGQQNQEIEKAVQLSEKIIRVLILCVDWMTDEDINKETPAARAEKEQDSQNAERKTDEFEDGYQDSDETESEDESSSSEVVATTEDNPQEDELVQMQSTETSEVPEPPAAEQTNEETDDSEQSQTKLTADE